MILRLDEDDNEEGNDDVGGGNIDHQDDSKNMNGEMRGKARNKVYLLKRPTDPILRVGSIRNVEGRKGEYLECLYHEMRVLHSINHPNIIKIYECVSGEDIDGVMVVTEYCERKSLEYILENIYEHRKKKDLIFMQKNLKSIITQVVFGLRELSRYGMVHGNINPSTIYLTRDCTVKLSGFDVHWKVNYRRNGIQLNEFTSPETIRTNKISESSDIWALGVTLYSILFGKLPYSSQEVEGLKQEILSGQCKLPGYSPIGEDLSEYMVLMKKMMEFEEENRSTLDSLIKEEMVRGEMARCFKLHPSLYPTEYKNQEKSILGELPFNREAFDAGEFEYNMKLLRNERVDEVMRGVDDLDPQVCKVIFKQMRDRMCNVHHYDEDCECHSNSKIDDNHNANRRRHDEKMSHSVDSKYKKLEKLYNGQFAEIISSYKNDYIKPIINNQKMIEKQKDWNIIVKSMKHDGDIKKKKQGGNDEKMVANDDQRKKIEEAHLDNLDKNGVSNNRRNMIRPAQPPPPKKDQNILDNTYIEGVGEKYKLKKEAVSKGVNPYRKLVEIRKNLGVEDSRDLGYFPTTILNKKLKRMVLDSDKTNKGDRRDIERHIVDYGNSNYIKYNEFLKNNKKQDDKSNRLPLIRKDRPDRSVNTSIDNI